MGEEKKYEDDGKIHGKQEEEYMHLGGLHIGRNNLLLMAGGALGTLATLGLSRFSKKVRPATVGVVKEGYAFKEWTRGKVDELKEDIEDIVAEAVYEYEHDLGTAADTEKRERELLQKIEKMVEEKLAEIAPESKEEKE